MLNKFQGNVTMLQIIKEIICSYEFSGYFRLSCPVMRDSWDMYETLSVLED